MRLMNDKCGTKNDKCDTNIMNDTCNIMYGTPGLRHQQQWLLCLQYLDMTTIFGRQDKPPSLQHCLPILLSFRGNYYANIVHYGQLPRGRPALRSGLDSTIL